MPHNLTPGIAFITGGARGLGNAIAVSFAKEGASGIALVDVQDEETFAQGKDAVEKLGVKCITIRADVTKEGDVQRAVKKCVDAFGRIDYAANFAGILGSLEPTSDMHVENFKKVLEVNMIGVWLSCKHEMAQMKKQDSIAVEEGRIAQRGSIVNAASVNSIMAGANTSPYTTSKHAVVGLTKTAALEGREHHIRVNSISPGFLRTKLLDGITGGAPLGEVELFQGFEARQGRPADNSEIGDVVVMMSSPMMSLVNGHNLVADGGFTINQNND